MITLSSIQPNDRDQLFDAFKNGDSHALRPVFDATYQSLYQIIYGMIGNSEDAKDIVSNAFAKLLKDRARINDFEHMRRYLLLVARNEAIDYFRKRNLQRWARHDMRQQGEDVYTEPTAYEIVLAGLLEKVEQEVQQMPERRRVIFQLRFYAGQDVRSIANQLSIKEQTVRNQLARGIIHLRKVVGLENLF